MVNNYRRKLINKIVGAIAISQIWIADTNAQSDYFVPGFLINAFLKNKFPLSRDFLLLKIELSNPDLEFLSQNQRLAMSSNFSAMFIGNSPINGQLHFSSSFIYDPTNKAIKLRDPTIDRLKVQNFSEKGGQSLQQINVWIAKLLDNMTVYEFKENEVPLIKKAPNKILVEDAGLRLFFD